MATGRSLVLKYFPRVVPKVAWSPDWGSARMSPEKAERRRKHEARRREARARRQART